MRILGISGSLRKHSWNAGLLRTAAKLLPEHEFSIAEIGDLPLMNEDLEHDGGFPAPVERFRGEVRAADALLIATPEYNASIPAPLKNAIDWGSRPGNCFAFKPAAICGASPGALGTSRSQYIVRHTLGVLSVQLLCQPEVFIGGAAQKFAGGELTDPATLEFFGKMLETFIVFANRVKLG